MTTLVYLILPNSSSEIGLILLAGMFITQIALDANYNLVSFFGSYFQKFGCLLKRQRQKCSKSEGHQQRESLESITNQSVSHVTVESKMMIVSSAILQLTFILGFIAVWGKLSGEFDYRSLTSTSSLMIGYSVVLLILSVTSTNTFQEYISEHKKFRKSDEITIVEKTGNDVLSKIALGDNKWEQSEADDLAIARFTSSKYSYAF